MTRFTDCPKCEDSMAFHGASDPRFCGKCEDRDPPGPCAAVNVEGTRPASQENSNDGW